MSKLPNAPLVEVVAEIKWKVENKADLSKIQYLPGDLFNEVKKKYPERESIIPPDIPLELVLNKPAHRFKSDNKDGYPLIQVGAGVVTLNTLDKIYQWETFFDELQKVTKRFIRVFPYEQGEKEVYPSILFLDFFPFDFENRNAIEYINQYFNITLQQNFFETDTLPGDLNLKFSYEVDLGDLIVTFQRGKNNEQKEGILMQTRINGISLNANAEDISGWFESAHEFLQRAIQKTNRRRVVQFI
ncbi:MAG: TIGR04255 family protein [Bacteroidales bacterium]|nr:TIGR04255 family protein [Bacteroidales bacterium]